MLDGQPVTTASAAGWFFIGFDRDAPASSEIRVDTPEGPLLRRLDILPVEIVVRGYLAGTTGTSILTLYKSGKRDIYGFHFPDGMRANEKLPQPIITPTTKEFDGGYIRFSAKYLDDATPTILPQPVRVTGSNGSPNYQAIPGFDPRTDSLYSPFLTPARSLDGNNNPASYDFRDGLSVQSKTFGIESEFDVGGGWTLTNRFRFADISGQYNDSVPFVTAPAPFFGAFGGPGARLSYAAGPLSGQAISEFLAEQRAKKPAAQDQ